MPSEPNEPVDVFGDRALVVAIRCGSAAALREFVLRYRPMLVLAGRRWGLAEDERDDVVDEVLHDTAIHLTDPGAPVPVAVRGYLLRSLRNRIANARRTQERRSRATAAATDSACEAEPHFEQAVVGCASEHSVRASHGPGWDGPRAIAPGLARLVTLLTAGLSVEDRALVEWLGHHVPQQEIAAWLGIGYDATSKRVRRLRARLQAVAVRHIEHLNPAERQEVMAFLRRATMAELPIGRAPEPVTHRARDVTRRQ
jgi:DNA-directed RNA polymerase specialized sigma24 family protein